MEGEADHPKDSAHRGGCTHAHVQVLSLYGSRGSPRTRGCQPI